MSSLEQQHLSIRPYEGILFGLKARPHFMFRDAEELHDFCEALELAWNLLPDSWIGLMMMLDYLT